MVDICTTRFDFSHKKFLEIICKKLEIEPQQRTKPKKIHEFNSKVNQLLTHAIYFTLSISIHIQSLVFLFLLQLKQQLLISCHYLMKKHIIFLHVIHDFIIFNPRFCMYLEVLLFITFEQSRFKVKKIVEDKLSLYR